MLFFEERFKVGVHITLGLYELNQCGDPEAEEQRQNELRTISAMLTENKEGIYEEPVSLYANVTFTNRGHQSSIGHSFFATLRRAVAYQIKGTELTELGPEEMAQEDPILENELYMFSSSIACALGKSLFFIPADISPTFGDVYVGCVMDVIKELKAVAASLKINLVDNVLTDSEAQILSNIEDGEPFFRERITWFALWENAHVAVKFNVAVQVQ